MAPSPKPSSSTDNVTISIDLGLAEWHESVILEQHVGRPIQLDLARAKPLEQLLLLDATNVHRARHGSTTADCLAFHDYFQPQVLRVHPVTQLASYQRVDYGFVDRANPDEVLNTFDVAAPAMTMGKRYETTVPQQALFLMNSPLVIEQVRTVVNREVFQNAASDEARIAFLYELFFQRLANEDEVRAGRTFVAEFQTAAPEPTATDTGRGRGAGSGRPTQGGRGQGRRGGRGPGAAAPRLPLNGWQEYAHALLLTNEAAFIH